MSTNDDLIKNRIRELIHKRLSMYPKTYMIQRENVPNKIVFCVYVNCTEHELTPDEHKSIIDTIAGYECDGYTYVLPVYTIVPIEQFDGGL